MMMTRALVLLSAILLATQGNGDIARVAGTVINTETNEPLDGVQVRLKSTGGVVRAVLTTRDGKFVIADLPPDTYAVTLSRASFVTPEVSHGPLHLKVKPGDDLKDLRFGLVRGSVITGRILDQNAAPLSAAMVLAMRVEYLNGRRVLLPGGLMSRILYSPLEPNPRTAGPEFTLGPPQVRVNEKGEYRLFGLEAGEYYVAIWQKSGDNPTADLPPIYYPGVADPAAAIPVRIDGSREVSGIDIRVAPIQGYVARFSTPPPTTSPFNCVLPGVRSYSLPAQRTFILVQHTADLDIVHFSAQRLPGREDDIGADNIMAGRFRSIGEHQWETSKLAPGSYELYHSFCLAAAIGLAGRTTFEIQDRDVEGVTITLPPSVSLRGRVRNNPGSSAPLSQVLLRMRPTDWRGLHPGMAPNPAPAQRLSVGTDGAFVFEHKWNGAYAYGNVAPGHYQIDVAGLPPEVYVASMKYGAKEVRDSGIDINGDPEGDLQITLDSPGATIVGVVKDNKGGIVPDAKVALVSQNPNVIAPLSPTTDTAQDGTFSFQGVAPGNYAVFAWTAIPKGAWNDLKFLEPFQSRGRKVQAEKGSTISIELQVMSPN